MWFWVVPLFMAAAPLPRLVFGRGSPVPAAAARPAPRMALRPAQPRAAAGFSLSSGGLSFSFCSFFLAARPRPLQGGVVHLGAGHRLTRQPTPVKYYGGKFAPSVAILFSKVLFLRLLRPLPPCSCRFASIPPPCPCKFAHAPPTLAAVYKCKKPWFFTFVNIRAPL